MEHSSIGGSGAEQFINCPASVQMQEKADINESSVWADEGTAAHFVGDHCLSCNRPVSEMSPETFPQHEQYLTYETFERVQKYIDVIHSQLTPGCVKKFEQKINLDWLYPESVRRMFGTVDAVVGEEYGTLYITDLKYGEWIFVDAYKNAQLMYYALGVLGKDNPMEYQKVVMSVVQPRIWTPNGITRSYTLPVEELYKWGYEVLKPAVILTEGENPPMKMGKWCRFCDLVSENATKAGICPAIGKELMRLTDTDFTDPLTEFPNDDEMDGEKLSLLLEYITVFNKWMKNAKATALMKAEAGETIPGNKLVKARSNRIWKNSEEATKVLNGLVKKGRIFSQPKLLSPAQIEALAKKKGIGIGKISKLWTKPERGVTLVPDSDPRQAVDATPEFEKVAEDDLW